MTNSFYLARADAFISRGTEVMRIDHIRWIIIEEQVDIYWKTRWHSISKWTAWCQSGTSRLKKNNKLNICLFVTFQRGSLEGCHHTKYLVVGGNVRTTVHILVSTRMVHFLFPHIAAIGYFSIHTHVSIPFTCFFLYFLSSIYLVFSFVLHFSLVWRFSARLTDFPHFLLISLSLSPFLAISARHIL